MRLSRRQSNRGTPLGLVPLVSGTTVLRLPGPSGSYHLLLLNFCVLSFLILSSFFCVTSFKFGDLNNGALSEPEAVHKRTNCWKIKMTWVVSALPYETSTLIGVVATPRYVLCPCLCVCGVINAFVAFNGQLGRTFGYGVYAAVHHDNSNSNRLLCSLKLRSTHTTRPNLNMHLSTPR